MTDECSLARCLKYDVDRLGSRAERIEEANCELREQASDFRWNYVDRKELKSTLGFSFLMAGCVVAILAMFAISAGLSANRRLDDLGHKVDHLSAELVSISTSTDEGVGESGGG